MTKTALITGITGQDGSYLAEFLLEKDYNVISILRRSSTGNLKNIVNIKDRITLIYGDLLDQSCLDDVIQTYKPDEVYGLAAMSFVPLSWQMPTYTMDVNATGTVKLLEAIRNHSPESKFYFAGSSEQFGKVVEIPQTENTPFYPRSPYGVSKCAGYWATKNYRESYSLYACSGLAFNHESPRRGIEFVTRKISTAVAMIRMGYQKELYLGNLDAKRDWSYSGDIVRAMWMMLQQDKPDDFVIGSEETHSVREFCDVAFKYFDMNYEDYVKIDPKFYRPAEVDILISDCSKIRDKLGWYPKYNFEDLVKYMVKSDYNYLDIF